MDEAIDALLTDPPLPSLKREGDIAIYLAEPRGFCSGVVRAINLVEKVLADFGAPVFVLNEIVHNKHVVKRLQDKGAVFVKALDEVLPSRPLIFSAHGVSAEVAQKAADMGLKVFDATCPLVKKVHKQVQDFDAAARQIIVIGKRNHPEIIGVVGQALSSQNIHVIGSLDEAKALPIEADALVGMVTQTTLCADEIQEIIDYLYSHFSNIAKMKTSDICYATTQRQAVIKELSKDADMVIVLGSKNSSNSNKLREVALANGAKQAVLIDDVSEMDWGLVGREKELEKEKGMDGFLKIIVTAGASAPEGLVRDLVVEFERRYEKIKINGVE